jgi:putative tryptophan/tyrosine transport system substrate-binding protein
MRRRAFFTLLGGAAAVWPLAARAQQPMPVIGYVRSESFNFAQHMIAGFRQGLKELGYIGGQNVAIEYHSAEGDRERLSSLVAELVRRQVAMIVGNSIAAKAAKAATNSVPIIFVYGGDPIKDGLVASINKPEGNVTGVTFFTSSIGAKRLELLRELVPQSDVIAALQDPDNTSTMNELKDIEVAARTLGRELVVARTTSEREFEAAFTMFMQKRAGSLLVGGGPLFVGHRGRVIALAQHHALPAIYQTRQDVEMGGLVSYGSSQADAYREAGIYAARILQGAKPSDLPVVFPTKFELVINLKTAKTLGLVVPQGLHVAADEVIE